ncbi:MAG: response regulator [Nitrospirales bacterium]|nr:MAG: response regulator [Nitrospirales bacterium]
MRENHEKTTMTSGKPITVLLVEDDQEDILLTQDALRRSKLTIELEVVTNGEHALSYLRQESPYTDKLRPDLVLLDINLPRKNGWEVLEAIKTHDRLKSLPVTMLTTSSEDPDIQRSYELGANSYITKPVGIEEFHRVVQAIEDFWFTIVKLPR